MLLANSVNENSLNSTLVAAAVPKVTRAFSFFDSSISRCSRKRGDRRRPFSCGFSHVGIFKESLYVVGSESKMSVCNPARPILVDCLGVFKNELSAAWFK